MNEVEALSPLQVTFWGTRGSISTPGRATEKYGGNTSCVTIDYEKTTIIIDAGTGIRNFGLDFLEESDDPTERELHLLLSHTHWDHIQGLPFFQPAYIPGVKLRIHGAAHKGGFLESILRGQMDEEYFPVSMSALGAELKVQELSTTSFMIGPVRVDWEEQIYHPGGCIRYRFSVGDKRIVYASDVELNKATGVESEENRAYLERYREFVQGADLLIGDGQYTDDEYCNRVNFGHSSVPVLIEQAQQAQVKQLAIFHHDPQHSDSFLDDYILQLEERYDTDESQLNFFWAREGFTLPI